MRKLLFLTVALLTFGCASDFENVTVTYLKGIAIYADPSVLRDNDIIGLAQEVDKAGKIFISDELLLVGDVDKGIHVYDNSNPNLPIKVLFLDIPGNKEFYVKDNFFTFNPTITDSKFIACIIKYFYFIC